MHSAFALLVTSILSNTKYASAVAELYASGSARTAPQHPATCSISVIDPDPAFNVGIIKRGGKVKWAENNVERASRHFQYGSEWWVHRRLASLPAAKATNTSLVRATTKEMGFAHHHTLTQ